MNYLTVIKIVLARLRFIAVFLIAALIVGYWDDIKNHVDRWTRPNVAPDALAAASASDIEWYSTMHPHIVRSEPGLCPICSMPLVKRKKGEAFQLPADVLARVQLTPSRVAMAGVKTTPVDYRALTHEVRTVGVLDYDETRMRHISARVAGRADELFLNFTGQRVKKGDPVYSLYSPEVYTAQREYLQAHRRVNELQSGGSSDSRADAGAVYNASMQKLVLWGVQQEQLDVMEQEYEKTGKIPTHFTVTSPIDGVVIRKDIDQGHYVVVGEDPYTVADTSVLWLQAKVYERDISLVNVGQTVRVTPDAFPNDVVVGRVTFLAVELDVQTRTLDARVEVDNTDGKLRPGMFAQASISVPVVEAQATPAESETTSSASDLNPADIFAAGLAPYFKASTTLAADSAEGVSKYLHVVLAALEPLGTDPAFKEAFARFEEAVHETMGADLPTIRETFKTLSAAMIDMGKTAGVPKSAGDVQIFRCPMVKSNWLQLNGETRNPYYGSEMLDCGGPIAPLPVAAPASKNPTPASVSPAGKVLSIPRGALIDTGRRKVVYVQHTPGLFDMRAVVVGLPAGEFYPVLSGLEADELVVTHGAFLIDAENRLNPMPSN